MIDFLPRRVYDERRYVGARVKIVHGHRPPAEDLYQDMAGSLDIASCGIAGWLAC
ncbi:MAG: hypothetical protein AB1646_17680 [Thermodesulfobacteriota bacterium]